MITILGLSDTLDSLCLETIRRNSVFLCLAQYCFNFNLIFLLFSCKPNIDLIQIIIKPLINIIVDVSASIGNACIVGVHFRLRVTQTIGQVIYVK